MLQRLGFLSGAAAATAGTPSLGALQLTSRFQGLWKTLSYPPSIEFWPWSCNSERHLFRWISGSKNFRRQTCWAAKQRHRKRRNSRSGAHRFNKKMKFFRDLSNATPWWYADMQLCYSVIQQVDLLGGSRDTASAATSSAPADLLGAMERPSVTSDQCSAFFCNHRALPLLGFIIYIFLLRLVPRSLGRMSSEEHEVRDTKKFSFNSATLGRAFSAPVASSPAPVVWTLDAWAF